MSNTLLTIFYATSIPANGNLRLISTHAIERDKKYDGRQHFYEPRTHLRKRGRRSECKKERKRERTCALRGERRGGYDCNMCCAVWPNLAKFRHLGKILKVIGKILRVYLALFWTYFGQIFIVKMPAFQKKTISVNIPIHTAQREI